MRKIGILVLIGILSLNSIGLAAKKSKKTKVDTITNTNNENSKSKKSIFRKLLKKKDDDSWELVWNDEFDGDTLDLSKWSYWENDNPSKNGNYVDENGNVRHIFRKVTPKVKEPVKHLANTGSETSNSAAAGFGALIAGIALAVRRRQKEDK